MRQRRARPPRLQCVHQVRESPTLFGRRAAIRRISRGEMAVQTGDSHVGQRLKGADEILTLLPGDPQPGHSGINLQVDLYPGQACLREAARLIEATDSWLQAMLHDSLDLFLRDRRTEKQDGRLDPS